MTRLYGNDAKGTVDLDSLRVDDGNAWADGPHDAPRIQANITKTDDTHWGIACWTKVDWDKAAEDMSDACDWANPDYLVDDYGYRYARIALTDVTR